MVHLTLIAAVFVASALSPAFAVSSRDTGDAYDFVIIGGGTCGLVVANRLSELKDITVAVIEAGGSVYDNPNVTNPDAFVEVLQDTNINWNYVTTNQTYAGGRQLSLSAGKAIGGTSVINGMTYTRTEDVQIDSWEKDLGNKGWNWKSLLNYYKKSETFQKPSAAAAAVGASYDPHAVGFQGPVKVGWSPGFSNSSVSHILNTTNQNLDLPWVPDMGSGRMRGYSLWPKEVDAKANIRSDAARSYYWPYQSRKNLKVMSNTLAHRIMWSTSNSSSGLLASGVEVTGSDGQRHQIKAKREVILSGGSLKSPQLLELSGIGNPDILAKFDIPVKVALKAVGEHLQEQTLNSITFNTTGLNVTGYPQYVSYVAATDIFGNSTAQVASSVMLAIPEYAVKVAKASNGAVNSTTLESLFRVQHDLLFRKNMPIAEILYAPSQKSFSVIWWPSNPFARGSIHITANDISVPAAINPNYFMLPFDEQVSAAVGNYVRRMFATQPVKQYIGAELVPGLEAVPKDASTEQWSHYLKMAFGPNNHPLSSAAMYPRELGGVVSNELKVYGTRNVRVVDASVLPQQLVGHLSSTLYAVSEKASEAIKDSLEKSR